MPFLAFPALRYQYRWQKRASVQCHTQRICQRDRDTVGFFTGRGRGAPDTVFAAASTRVVSQHRKMMSFAEKSGQVGGQGINKRLPLSAVLVGFQHAEIATKVVQPVVRKRRTRRLYTMSRLWSASTIPARW